MGVHKNDVKPIIFIMYFFYNDIIVAIYIINKARARVPTNLEIINVLPNALDKSINIGTLKISSVTYI